MYTGWCPLAKHVPPHGTHRPTFQKIDEFPQIQLLDKLMTSVVVQRQVPGRDSADNCEFPQLLEVPVEISQVQFLDKFDTIVLRLVMPVCPSLLRACAQLLTWLFGSVLGTRLGVQIVPMPSSSELSSHQMAIRSHPGSSKNARQWHFIRAARSSNGSSRSLRALEGSTLPSCFVPFVFLPRLATPALRFGVIGSLRPWVLHLFL